MKYNQGYRKQRQQDDANTASPMTRHGILNPSDSLPQQKPGKATEVAGQRPDAERIAAWVSIVQVLFNLDESITKD